MAERGPLRPSSFMTRSSVAAGHRIPERSRLLGGVFRPASRSVMFRFPEAGHSSKGALRIEHAIVPVGQLSDRGTTKFRAICCRLRICLPPSLGTPGGMIHRRRPLSFGATYLRLGSLCRGTDSPGARLVPRSPHVCISGKLRSSRTAPSASRTRLAGTLGTPLRGGDATPLASKSAHIQESHAVDAA